MTKQWIPSSKKHDPNDLPPEMSVLFHSIVNKYKEAIENTVFELMTIVECSTLQELEKKNYVIDVIHEQGVTKTTVSLWRTLKEKQHIISYTISFDLKENKVKRDRKVNNLDPEDYNGRN